MTAEPASWIHFTPCSATGEDGSLCCGNRATFGINCLMSLGVDTMMDPHMVGLNPPYMSSSYYESVLFYYELY